MRRHCRIGTLAYWHILIMAALLLTACDTREKEYDATLMTLDPGHFHAGLVQKVMYPEVNPEVYVYAPDGPEVETHMAQIEGYNTREENPTHWKSQVYKGDDFFERMLSEKPGNVLVLAGNNQKKTEYILDAVKNGIHIYSDKPMAINVADFKLLQEAFEVADDQGLLLYDIMTERFEITTILQKALSHIPAIFGELQTGSPDDPAVVKQSVHHFFKFVSGNKIKRPPWFFDVTQEGDGIVDVTTHLVDLIQWTCYPEVVLDYHKDIKMLTAERWPTILTPEEFNEVTRLSEFPDYLKKDLNEEGNLAVYCNGGMTYLLKDVYANVQVEWRYRAPEGTGDTHYSIIKGSKADLEIRQGEAEGFKPILYILPHQEDAVYLAEIEKAFDELEKQYPGIRLEQQEVRFKVDIPDHYKVGHEAHFGQVTEAFLQYLKQGRLPDWEVPNMIAKYYTTTAAFELAKKGN